MVSILTQPESWVQHRQANGCIRRGQCFNPHPARKLGATPLLVSRLSLALAVSILTQPESWVQLHALQVVLNEGQFQSSPSPKAGCNLMIIAYFFGFFHVSILTQPESWVQRPCPPDREGLPPCFNPHPARKLGATLAVCKMSAPLLMLFQSSPSPKAGCNGTRAGPARCFCSVSILTQPESWVQRHSSRPEATSTW